MSLSQLSLRVHLRQLKDPRRRHGRHHRLLDIILVAVCAVIAGADSWYEVEAFGRRQRKWLKRFLPLPNGIPSHDTIQRVFEMIDPEAFQACLRGWLVEWSGVLGCQQIAIDGKTLRHSGNRMTGLAPLHLVSAWATQAHLCLGQAAVAEGSNEITAIPLLLEVLDLKGALVTLDAMGCQKEIAKKIVAAGGDYVLVVKKNQGRLFQDLEDCLHRVLEEGKEGVDYDRYEKTERGHGREEYRSYVVVHNPQGISQKEEWAGLHTIGMCVSERTLPDKTSTEARYFIGSKKAGARYYGNALRNHWRIENCLHWQLDVSFGEDQQRTQARNASQNLALIRKQALALLKRNPAPGSIKSKRLQAGWDTAFLEEILCGAANLDKV
jgi:predicted transposase YbfD/YdcC